MQGTELIRAAIVERLCGYARTNSKLPAGNNPNLRLSLSWHLTHRVLQISFIIWSCCYHELNKPIGLIVQFLYRTINDFALQLFGQLTEPLDALICHPV